jgi:murein DD-endopeptidase MepM/ murein hydrolase activator NlpD
MLRKWQITGAWLFRSFFTIPKWWGYEYKDFRIILEQDGQLRYFTAPAGLQRSVARCAIAAFSLTALFLAALGATNLLLNSAKERLVKSHQAIYAALLAGSNNDGSGTELNMLDLANEIKERQRTIQQYIGYNAIAYKEENRSLMDQLRASDLSLEAIQAIERASVGGGAQTAAENSPLMRNLLPDSLVKDILKNRELRDILRSLPEQMPLKQFEITSDFGIRKHPITGSPHFHSGVDLVTIGTDERIFPAKPGTVIFADMQPQLGNTVILQHSHGIKTLYAHLREINNINVGDTVQSDTILGAVGNTGSSSTGPHLHFEVLIGGYATNPIKVIKAAKNVQQTH